MLCVFASKCPCVDVLLVPAVSFLFDIFSGAVDWTCALHVPHRHVVCMYLRCRVFLHAVGVHFAFSHWQHRDMRAPYEFVLFFDMICWYLLYVFVDLWCGFVISVVECFLWFVVLWHVVLGRVAACLIRSQCFLLIVFVPLLSWLRQDGAHCCHWCEDCWH